MQFLVNSFRNPYIGILGSVASIISVILAVYFYTASTGARELTYYIHPARTSLVNTDNVNKFQALYKGNPVKGDVSVVRVAFWNAGKVPIRKNDILKKLKIHTEAGQILEASINKKSRDVVNINLNKEGFKNGILEIDWNVLEKNDGASIQIIYAGGVNRNVTAQSILVGQKNIKELVYGNEIRTASEQYEHYEQSNRKSGFVFLGMGGVTVPLFFLLAWRRKKDKGTPFREYFDRTDLVLFLQPVLFIVMAVHKLFFSSPPFPPFGF